jgi:hypothetical protein
MCVVVSDMLISPGGCTWQAFAGGHFGTFSTSVPGWFLEESWASGVAVTYDSGLGGSGITGCVELGSIYVRQDELIGKQRYWPDARGGKSAWHTACGVGKVARLRRW